MHAGPWLFSSWERDTSGCLFGNGRVSQYRTTEDVFISCLYTTFDRWRPNWNVRALVNTGSRLLRGAYREKWRRPSSGSERKLHENMLTIYSFTYIHLFFLWQTTLKNVSDLQFHRSGPCWSSGCARNRQGSGTKNRLTRCKHCIKISVTFGVRRSWFSALVKRC